MEPTIKNGTGEKFQVADHAALICGYEVGTGQQVKLRAVQVAEDGALMIGGVDGDGNPQTLADAVAEGLAGGPRTVTPHVALLGASATQVIPSGAKGWSFAIMTGTATVGGVAGIPAGIGDSDAGTLAASLTITTAAASSAYVRWNT
jgi:hypothetical protein